MKILLIEESETCAECILGIYNKRWFCLGTGKDIDIISKSRYEKPSWCPLRPLPEKKEVHYTDPMFGEVTNLTNIGYNQCLAEITGEKE